jgi:hypothetical protein
MSRCPINKLDDLKPLLDEIRSWPLVKEAKPGIFYVKREPFLHFHEKDTKRWADLKTNGEFVSHDLPFDCPKTKATAFVKKAKQSYQALTAK